MSIPVGHPLAGRSGLRWVLYLRQSKKRRRADGSISSDSIEVQEQRCRERLTQLDRNPASISVIVDHGRSGGRGRPRAGRDQLLATVQAGRADAVMAYKAARIGRDIEESEHLWNQCSRHGALLTTLDCEDLSDPLVRSIYFGMAAKGFSDRQQYSLEVRRRRREAGQPPATAVAPYGLQWVSERLEVHPAEFPFLEEMFRRFDLGDSLGAIARDFSARRVPRRKSATGDWDASSISQKLRCSWYIGLIPDGDGYWDAGRCFIDRDLHRRVQARLSEQKRTGQGLDHVLSGLLYCGICGGPSPMSLCYSRYTRRDGSVLNKYRYRCIHHVRNRSACSGQSIDARRVERFLVKQIRAVVGGDELTQARFARRQRKLGEERAGQAEHHSLAIRDLEARQDELFERRQSGEVIPDRLYNRQMQRLEDQIQAHREREREALQRATLSQAATERLQKDLLGQGPLEEPNWNQLPPARRNQFLRLLFPDGLLVQRADRRCQPVEERLAVRRLARNEEALRDVDLSAVSP